MTPEMDSSSLPTMSDSAAMGRPQFATCHLALLSLDRAEATAIRSSSRASLFTPCSAGHRLVLIRPWL